LFQLYVKIKPAVNIKATIHQTLNLGLVSISISPYPTNKQLQIFNLHNPQHLPISSTLTNYKLVLAVTDLGSLLSLNIYMTKSIIYKKLIIFSSSIRMKLRILLNCNRGGFLMGDNICRYCV